MGKPKILEDWEKKNVNVPAGNIIFRTHFENIIAQQDPNHGKKQEEVYDYNGSEREKYFCKDIQPDDEEDLRSPQEIAFLASLRTRNLESQIVFKESYEKPPSYYYYKRWVWMQFPWGCGSFQNNYSDFITTKYAHPTEYMTV